MKGDFQRLLILMIFRVLNWYKKEVWVNAAR